ncbi:hypothetical protein PNOK_0768200 [Pyrrhoderma noxium]|uniref:Uncharacterized protein n=1 Tax=Pyrrhoderma noxium TaxID=2282107 RepID=A0A286U904_9AGAM|nr:hypothetical protein PNOK_0768200 [Pyrrhoderma noxium]
MRRVAGDKFSGILAFFCTTDNRSEDSSATTFTICAYGTGSVIGRLSKISVFASVPWDDWSTNWSLYRSSSSHQIKIK